MKLNATEKNALKAVEYLMWAAKVNVSSIGLKEELCLHPNFPTLAAVSDALSVWQIPNLVVKIGLNQLREIPLPALTYLNIDGGIFAPIRSVKDDSIEWLHTQKGWQRESPSSFESRWGGVVLLIEPNAQSGERDYPDNRQKDLINASRVPFLIVGTLLCLALIFTIRWKELLISESHFMILFVCKLFGTIVGGMLLLQSTGSDNTFIQNICQLAGGQSCNNILQSKAAKITSWITWAELGTIYFAGGFLTLVLGLLTFDLSVISLLLVLSALVVPYTIYSIWYQRNIAKQWCVLCLAVQLIFILEAAIALSHYHSGHLFQINPSTFLITSIAFTIPTLLWVLLKVPYQNASQLFAIQRELQKVKFNEQYISSIFDTQPNMPPIFEGMEILHLGNPEAYHVITVVTNPLCWPCAVLHKEINNLLDVQPKVRCQLIFLGGPEALKIATVFFETEICDQKEVVNSWYRDLFQDKKSWIKSHQKSIDHKIQSFALHRRWCNLADVTGTPTVFFNGRIFPTSYKIKDINELVKYIQVESEVNTY
jgi:uncharacterized membrane protein